VPGCLDAATVGRYLYNYRPMWVLILKTLGGAILRGVSTQASSTMARLRFLECPLSCLRRTNQESGQVLQRDLRIDIGPVSLKGMPKLGIDDEEVAVFLHELSVQFRCCKIAGANSSQPFLHRFHK
jgi:hypothetical protein